MLSACAGSPAPRASIAPDPVVELRTVTRTVCPDELLLPLPPREPAPLEAAIEAGQEVLRWIAGRFAREEVLEGRLADAKAQCPAS